MAAEWPPLTQSAPPLEARPACLIRSALPTSVPSVPLGSRILAFGRTHSSWAPTSEQANDARLFLSPQRCCERIQVDDDSLVASSGLARRGRNSRRDGFHWRLIAPRAPAARARTVADLSICGLFRSAGAHCLPSYEDDDTADGSE